ncbi:glycosyltransferase [Rubellicoccus peritrichatus]|uniref:Glycosyltransferase n=1 Tax=Rubellicoccus peritrichatus TaxID=3080537 RepID=A0AAQ3LBG3_9BACT|nr:glycosyltransferase [Puniceicoccus sp. CR14]WOO40810.1 glycosyltransferase [Puniceicoccus sp. CR14]
MKRLAVIICTYAPNMDFLTRTLDALNKQDLSTEKWRLVIVDNASPNPLSKDLLKPLIKRDFELITEAKPGLVFARLAGYEATDEEILVYVDDDNLLATDYLSKALEIAEQYPFLGAWSGNLVGEFEKEPTPDLIPYLDHLALREVKQEAWANFPNYNCSPWGAGMCLHRRVMTAYKKSMDSPHRSSLGVKGKSLARGEDTDIAYIACSIGLGIGVFPQLILTHIIPTNRLEKDYLRRIAEESTFANVMVSFLHGLPLPPTPTTLGRIKRLFSRLTQAGTFEHEIEEANIRGIKRALNAIKNSNSN